MVERTSALWRQGACKAVGGVDQGKPNVGDAVMSGMPLQAVRIAESTA